MGIIDNFRERKEYKQEFENAKKRLLADIERTKKTIADKTAHYNNLVEFANSNFTNAATFNETYTSYLLDKVSKGEFESVLSSAKQDVAYWNEIFKKHVTDMSLVRPNFNTDIDERARISESFAKQMEAIDPCGGYQLRFHATDLSAAISIINDGGLISAVDRTGSMLTTNLSNEISVSDINGIQYSVNYWMNTNPGHDCLPCGVMFVLEPSSKEEAAMIENNQMNNVHFNKHPEQLVAVITTSENIPKINKLMLDKGMDTSKLMTFNEAPTKIASKLPSLTRTVQEMIFDESTEFSIRPAEIEEEHMINNKVEQDKNEIAQDDTEYEELAV